MTKLYDKVVRIQGDKLCELLGYKKGTKIDIEIIRAVANSEIWDMIVLDGRSVRLSPYALAVAKTLLGKIES